jgi:uncharacterized damage-inducible protein DinB
MTSPRASSSVSPALLATGTEREVLESFLDFHRGVAVAKIRGLSIDTARRRLVPSLTTLAGIVQHLTEVERNWFGAILESEAPTESDGGSGSEDESWKIDEHASLDDLVDRYLRQCASSREQARRFTLDDTVPHPQLGRVSLRWIYVHLIEETARHVGHADILREQTDGAVGVLS